MVNIFIIQNYVGDQSRSIYGMCVYRSCVRINGVYSIQSARAQQLASGDGHVRGHVAVSVFSDWCSSLKPAMLGFLYPWHGTIGISSWGQAGSQGKKDTCS